MMMRKMLATGLMLGLAASITLPALAINQLDSLDTDLSENVVGRAVDVSQSGSIDLSHFWVLEPEHKLALQMTNNTANPVNVHIPDLESSFLVAANSTRVHYMNSEAVGFHNMVDYTVDPIITKVYPAIDLSSIQPMLDGSYSRNAMQQYDQAMQSMKKDEPVYHSERGSSGPVRGYW